MKKYHFTGTDKTGALCNGTIEAEHLIHAKSLLRKKEIRIKKITLGKNIKISIKIKNKKFNVTQFTNQLSTLISSGIPLTQSLGILIKNHQHHQNMLISIKSNLESGHAFYQSLAKYPDEFNALYCNLIEAGEYSGTLELMLKQISHYNERMNTLKKKIKSALSYPLIVICVATLVTLILLLLVMPQFESLFKSFGAELPALTLFVLNLSTLLQSYGLWLTAFVLTCAIAFILLFKKSSRVREALDKTLLKLPGIAELIKKKSIAQTARTLAITLIAGVPFVEALNITAKTLGNSVYRTSIIHISQSIAHGQRFAESLRDTRLFPSLVLDMVEIGEETGTLDVMLGHVGDNYEAEVDETLDHLSHLLEPLIMAILGIILGTLITAMYLPIFKLGAVL